MSVVYAFEDNWVRRREHQPIAVARASVLKGDIIMFSP